jgi:hypothetical protein
VIESTGTWWDDPAAPVLDMWASHRLPAPDGDFDTRHQRGVVRLPWEINPDPGERKGDFVDAWVCCGCGGVTLDECELEREHNCCSRCYPRTPERPHRPDGRCMHPETPHPGRYAPYWLPTRAASQLGPGGTA